MASDGRSSSSPSPHTPSSSTGILTPRRKVQALLGQLSDSESDGKISPTFTRRLTARNTTSRPGESSESSGSDGESIVPKGKLAARLLGAGDNRDVQKVPETTHQSLERITTPVANAVPLQAAHTPALADPALESSDDELVTAAAHRRPQPHVALGRSVSPADIPAAATARSVSPLFFSSPTSSINSEARRQRTDDRRPSPTVSASGGKSKFLALVEKHRRERIAREAAEVVKRAVGLDGDKANNAGHKRLQRGSSPADDLEESHGSSSDEAVKRISKEARPTRKASRKALEEMNRETQRISRNMQLAHQTKTRKKISKESLLARFNLVSNNDSTPAEAMSAQSAGSPSSSNSSGTEGQHNQSTPATSPMPQPEPNPTKTNVTTFEMHDGLTIDNDMRINMLDHRIADQGQAKIDACTHNNRVVLSLEPEGQDTKGELLGVNSHKPAPRTQSVRISVSQLLKPHANTSDSDSDIVIIKGSGQRRKFSVFETLGKRKAKETPSHLALRSLAHVIGHEDKKRPLNAAELDASLRRTARLQAIEERRQRIEDLRAKGHIIQTAEERERDQQEVEDLVERARQEAAEIQKREKEAAKKDGTYVKDGLDDDEDDSADEKFETDVEDIIESSESDENGNEDEEADENALKKVSVIDDEVEEADTDEEEQPTEVEEQDSEEDLDDRTISTPHLSRTSRRHQRIVSDDEDEFEGGAITDDKENQLPRFVTAVRTPQSIMRSAKKFIPGLPMSDDLPMGLSQAFAATMADSQSQYANDRGSQAENLPAVVTMQSPGVGLTSFLQRVDSLDMITDSQPASQIQAVPESPARGLGIMRQQQTPSQRPFEPTQDAGYILSPFSGSRFAETPLKDGLQSTIDTVILASGADDSPVMQRKGRLTRGRAQTTEEQEDLGRDQETAFERMQRAAKSKAAQPLFEKAKSDARKHFDEAAEESEDEYAGLGGASDEDADEEENEEDRQMIDEDTEIGRGDVAKLAALYADRERERDEKDVSKLLKDITTGALRRKRGAGDDLDLSDEEDAAARRREAKRREFARMRRELLKDEAVGKIAEDKKKEAFLKSIEDREPAEDDDDNYFDQPETQQEESQSQPQAHSGPNGNGDSQEVSETAQRAKQPLEGTGNEGVRLSANLRRTTLSFSRKPSNLAEIRESVSFLIEEPESQAAMIDLGLSDSEDDPEAYVDLDRHLHGAENDENAEEDDGEDLGDFIIDDERSMKPPHEGDPFKKPEVPSKERAPFSERRTPRADVVDRLSLLRQASSSGAGSNASSKMAFFASTSGPTSLGGVPSLLRRATTNSSLGSISGREATSATGVTTSNMSSTRTERGNASEEKEFIRKGSNGRRNAVNYQARTSIVEEKMSARAGIVKASLTKNKKKGGQGFLGGLFRGDSWD